MINFYRDRMTALPETQHEVFSKLIARTKANELLWRQDRACFSEDIYFAVFEEFQVFLKMDVRMGKEGPPHVIIHKINSLRSGENNEAILLGQGTIHNDSIGLFVAIRDQLEAYGSAGEEQFLKTIEISIAKTKNNAREETLLQEFIKTI